MEVYRLKTGQKLTIRQISKVLDITPREAQDSLVQAKKILRGVDDTWMNGLSQRAKTQLIKTDYTDAKTLCNDVLNDHIDLEELPRIGHKVAVEIRKWCRQQCK